ncbi:MAG TPA: hypothetical protein VFP72_22735 [Kineosporiaceae bacterium]|nr:hypothetical protein [Kineosporiaceae bacterium]
MGIPDVVGLAGIVTTTIPVGGLGEVRVRVGLGSQTFGAYASNRGMSVPSGTRVTIVEYFPPRTVIVSPDQ